MRRSALMITTDSGPRHFAAAFGTPVITLFGPTHIAWTRTYHPQAWHIIHKVPCGPCQRPVCPEGHHRCMRDLVARECFPGGAALARGDGKDRCCRRNHGGVRNGSLASYRCDRVCRTASPRIRSRGCHRSCHPPTTRCLCSVATVRRRGRATGLSRPTSPMQTAFAGRSSRLSPTS